MKVSDKIKKFNEWEERLSAYRMALTLIGIDQTLGAPPQGAEYRDSRSAILQGEFRRLVKDEEMFGLIGELIGEASGELDPDPSKEGDLRRRLELYHDELTRDRAVPLEVYMEYARILDRSKLKWLQAKKDEDYKGYAPCLQEVVDGYKKIVSLQDSPLGIYDRMLDQNQPGWTMARYDEFFRHVKERVVPIVKSNGERPKPDRSFLEGEYDIEKQRRVMAKVREMIGFTESWGRMGESEHPLTTGVSRGDVRFTTKFRKGDPSAAILSTIHESGHAWFTHNVDPRYEGTIIADSISAGLHESQSRFCENHLGRSAAFWEKVYPWLQEEFKEKLGGVSRNAFLSAVNAVRPSAIRTKADEVTYPLHILIRYELEREMMEGGLLAADLESAWNEKYSEYLGITPRIPSEGVLQDMHWPYAYFGYFPTYALGSAMAAQFYNAMCRDLDPEKLIREWKYTEIMAWLGTHVQRYANRYEADEVMKLATGEEFTDEYYFRHLEEKYLG